MKIVDVLCAFLTSAALAGSAAAQAPSYKDYKQSVVIPYTQKVDFHHLDKTLKVHASINGGPIGEFTVDTGSVGIMVAADDVPNLDPKGKPGTLTYSSSGVELHGIWTTATVTFTDAKGGEATALVPVLAVQSSVCTGSGVNAENCHPSDHPRTHMMGIGFGRGQTEGRPEKNPFLNLAAMQAGTMRRGYVIAEDGITLGLTDSAVSGFVWQKLTERPVSSDTKLVSASLKDWETAPGSFKVKDLQAPAGSVLMDTGLTNLMLAVPNGPGKGEVPPGTPVTVELLGGKLRYTFNVGDVNDPSTPRRASWVRASHGVFVNTGLRALSGFDYLYDSDGGWLALRPKK